MENTNYISSIVQILEKPRKTISEKNVMVTNVRAQLSEARNNKLPTLVRLIFWGKLSQAVLDYYQATDYLVVEGYVSIKNRQELESKSHFLKCIEITVLKIYPFLLSSKYS